MRSLLLCGLLATATLSSACVLGTCTSLCANTAMLTAVDSAGNALTLQTVTENTALAPTSGCGVLTDARGPAVVSSYCTRFAIDAVATNGKRFSGIIDVSGGTDGTPVCNTVCKSASITIQLD